MSDKQPSRTFPVILVVDDDARNTKLLTRILESEGYRTHSAPDGETALALVPAVRPDMLLVDVMMPGLDGYELCRRIKQDVQTRAIPTLLVTALNGLSDKVRGLDAGADDFLTKPINRAELLARVRTHFRIKSLRDEVVESRESLARQNRKLEALEGMREELTHMLVHDLKSPLSAILLNVELLEQAQSALPQGLATTTIGNISTCANKLSTLVQNILDVALLEETEISLQLTEFSLGPLLEDVSQAFAVPMEMESKRLVSELPPELPSVLGDREMILRVLQNLVSNAVKVTPEGGEVLVLAERSNDDILITVADRGQGVPEHLRDEIFDKFSSIQAKREGLSANHGLGLTFSRMAVETHGGRVWMEPRDGGGSLFRFTLPCESAARHETIREHSIGVAT